MIAGAVFGGVLVGLALAAFAAGAWTAWRRRAPAAPELRRARGALDALFIADGELVGRSAGCEARAPFDPRGSLLAQVRHLEDQLIDQQERIIDERKAAVIEARLDALRETCLDYLDAKSRAPGEGPDAQREHDVDTVIAEIALRRAVDAPELLQFHVDLPARNERLQRRVGELELAVREWVTASDAEAGPADRPSAWLGRVVHAEVALRRVIGAAVPQVLGEPEPEDVEIPGAAAQENQF